MSKKMKILVSNDDGIYSSGLRILAKELRKIAQVVVVAPLEEKSTMGHSLTIHKPLRIQEIDRDFYGINGSPADCVYIGIREILKGMPDLVVSGPNRGGNLGQDVYYSGTVSAAREACILGLPAFALSVDVSHTRRRSGSIDVRFDTAARFLVNFLKRFEFAELPKHTLLNINVPNLPLSQIDGFEFTRQGFRFYSGTVLKRIDHRGKPYFWVGGQYKGFHNAEGTDCAAVDKRSVSITPVQLDCTNYNYLKMLVGR